MARTAGTGQQPRACGPGRGLLGSWRLLVEAPPRVLTALPHPPSLLCAPPWSPGLEPPGRVSCLDAEGVTGGGRAKPAGSAHLAGTGMGRPPSMAPAPLQGVGAQGARGRVAPVPWDLWLPRGGKSSQASAARIGPHGRGRRPRSPGVWGGRQHSTRSRRGRGCRLTRPRLRPAGRRRS